MGTAKKKLIAIISIVTAAVITATTVFAYDSFDHTTASGVYFEGLVTDDNGFMAYGYDDGWNEFFVLGRTANENDPWASTCYKATGWHVGLYYNNMSDYYIVPSGSTMGCGLAVSLSPSFSADGKTLYVTYSITNNNKFTRKFAVWTYGSPEVGGSRSMDISADPTSITLSGGGDTLTISAYDGATFWGGDYSAMNVEGGGFRNLQATDYSSYSGAAFYWDGLELAGKDSMEITVSFQLDSVLDMESIEFPSPTDPDPNEEPTTTTPETTEPDEEPESETTTPRPTDPWDTDIPADHVHSYELMSIAPPTFTTASVKNYQCSCGDAYQELVRFPNGLANSAASDGNWYYMENNKVKDITTIINNNYGWWMVRNGMVDFSANTIEHNDMGWWYLDGGKVDFNYNGFGSNYNGDWYCENGKVNFNVTDVIQGTLKGEKAWWNLVNSKVEYGTTIAHNCNGWWYCVGGKVDFNYTGLGNNANGWWYCKDGKVDFSYNGIVPYGNASWYVKGGQVQFGYTGTYQVGTKVYNIKLGKVESVSGR